MTASKKKGMWSVKGGLLHNLLDFVALTLVRALVGIMALLPHRVAGCLARGVVELFFIIMPRLRPVALKNLEIVFPEKTISEREDILARSLWVFSRNLVAFAKIPQLSRESAPEYVDYRESKALIDRLRVEYPGIGTLVPTLHFGNFEMLVQLHALSDRPISFLARGFGFERLDTWWNERRQIHKNEGFRRKGGYHEVIRRLGKGQDVAVLFDQNVKVNHAVFVDLFGLPAATTKTLGIAALRTRCPIVFAVLAEVSPNRYKMITEVMRNPVDDPGSIDERISSLMADLHRCIEKVVREYPEQWMWFHRRYKTRPHGEPEDIYSKA